jgi:hypothetical protein
MTTGRKGLSCALVKNPHDGSDEIVASGGHIGSGSIRFPSTVEIFNLGTQRWSAAGG